MKIAVLTTSRADYGLLEKLIERIYDDLDTKNYDIEKYSELDTQEKILLDAYCIYYYIR